MAYSNKTTPAVGTSLPFDDVGAASFPRSKPVLGGEGAAADAVGGAGNVGPGVQRMTLAGDDVLVVRVGAITDEPWDGTGDATVIGALKAIAAGILDTNSPAGVTRAGTIRGYAVVTNATLAASVALPAPPAGAKSMILIAEGQDVRFNPDGAATATSVPIKAGQPGYELPLPATPANARLIRAADGATLHILWVG